MIRAKSRRLVIVAVAAVAMFLVSGCDLYSYLPGTPRPSWCDPTDTARERRAHPRFASVYTTPKGPLVAERLPRGRERFATGLRDFAVKYPTVAAAQAAGWVQATVFTPGQGAHFVDPNRLTGPFDPTPAQLSHVQRDGTDSKPRRDDVPRRHRRHFDDDDAARRVPGSQRPLAQPRCALCEGQRRCRHRRGPPMSDVHVS